VIVSCLKCGGTGRVCPKCGASRISNHACGYSRSGFGRGAGCGTRAKSIACPGVLGASRAEHFASFVECDICRIRSLGSQNYPVGWTSERRPTLNAWITICEECSPVLEQLKATVLDRLLETREGINANRRWCAPGSPKFGPDCPESVRIWNRRETLLPAHRAIVEMATELAP
jgi:hypothetical protein